MELFLFLYLQPILCKLDFKNDFLILKNFALPWLYGHFFRLQRIFIDTKNVICTMPSAPQVFLSRFVLCFRCYFIHVRRNWILYLHSKYSLATRWKWKNQSNTRSRRKFSTRWMTVISPTTITPTVAIGQLMAKKVQYRSLQIRRCYSPKAPFPPPPLKPSPRKINLAQKAHPSMLTTR